MRLALSLGNWLGRVNDGPTRILFGDATLSQLAQSLERDAVDRRVIDQTGIATVVSIRLEFAPDENAPCLDPAGTCPSGVAPGIPSGQSIFTTLEHAGLKLEPIQGPRGYLVIDRVERPSGN